MMRAYHGDPAVKAAIIAQLEAHRAADRLVGCTLHSSDHAEYEPRFGIPVALARLEDKIFEGLPNERAMRWPVEFMSAVPVGADLSRVRWQFLHWLLTEELAGRERPLVRDAIANVAALMRRLADGEAVAQGELEAAADWATRATKAAAKAGTRAAAWAARAAAAAGTAAARAATKAAAKAGTRAAAWAARAAAAAGTAAARAAARAASYERQADKLLQLLREAPVFHLEGRA